MEKSIYSKDYAVLLALLRAKRHDAGVTQEEIAEQLGTTQSVISKCERGERRLDLVEVRAFCNALDLPLERFISELEAELRKKGGR